MVRSAKSEARSRRRLSRERVLRAAIAHADAGGLEALTMRTLAEMLEVTPMALYRHVADKDDLVNAMVDAVFTEIGVPSGGGDWKTAMRRRAISAHEVLARHPWAIDLMESRSHPGPANLQHHDAMLGSLRAAGFSIAMAAHAYSLLDSYIHGFALQHTNDHLEEAADVSHSMLQPYSTNEYPNLGAMIEHAMEPGYELVDEFEFGLDMILDALDRIREAG